MLPKQLFKVPPMDTSSQFHQSWSHIIIHNTLWWWVDGSSKTDRLTQWLIDWLHTTHVADPCSELNKDSDCLLIDRVSEWVQAAGPYWDVNEDNSVAFCPNWKVTSKRMYPSIADRLASDSLKGEKMTVTWIAGAKLMAAKWIDLSINHLNQSVRSFQ